MAGSDLPSYTLVQGSAVSFIAGMFLGIYLISLAFALRWLIFTDDGWMFRKTVHWFTFIVTTIIAVFVSVNQILKVDVASAEAKFVEQGHTAEEYVETLHWRPILQVRRYLINHPGGCKLMHSCGRIVHRYDSHYFTCGYDSGKFFLENVSDPED
jgi:hypothetical protein